MASADHGGHAGRTGPAHLIGARHRPGADDADLRLIPFTCAQAIAGSPRFPAKEKSCPRKSVWQQLVSIATSRRRKRTEELGVGKEGVSTGRARGRPKH